MIAFLTSGGAKLIAVLLMVTALVGSGAVVMHKLDTAKYETLVAADAKAQAAAVTAALTLQHTFAADAQAAAQSEDAAQLKLATEFQLHQQEVVRYVPVIRSCVPLGLVRVLHAAAIGVPAAGVPLPTGKSDDACTTIAWPTLARSIIGDFGIARANGLQLDALIGFERKAQGDAK